MRKKNYSIADGVHQENFSDKLLLVMAGTSCNNHCLFCSISAMARNYDRTTKEIILDLEKNKGKYQGVEFTGGEFAMRDDALLLVTMASRLDYKTISVETNGKVFAYRDFALQMVSAGLTRITFSIHGASPLTHDRITDCEGSFSHAMCGLKNICSQDIDVSVNFVITKFNFREITAFAEIIKKIKKVSLLHFSFVRPLDRFSEKDFLSIVPRFSEVLPFLKKVSRRKNVSFRDVPPCLLNADKIESHREKENITMNYGKVNIRQTCYNSLLSMMMQPDKCFNCALKKKCPGIYKKYFRYYQDFDLRPVSGKIK
jgi:MoaA/NifB/PqqE/SkfB family radical SAM enzyme